MWRHMYVDVMGNAYTGTPSIFCEPRRYGLCEMLDMLVLGDVVWVGKCKEDVKAWNFIKKLLSN